MKKILLLLLVIANIGFSVDPTVFTELKVNEGFEVVGTSTLTGAISLGSTIAVDSILEKTSAHGVSLDLLVLAKDGTLTATTLTDGTAIITAGAGSGFTTFATTTASITNLGSALDAQNQNITNIDIDSGAIDGVVIGGASAGAITGTTITGTTVDVNILGGAMDANNENITNVDIDSGAIDGTIIGAASAVAGTFTTVAATTGNITNVVATNLTGTLQTAAQTNITSVGTLSSLVLGGAITGASNVASVSFNGSGLSILNSARIGDSFVTAIVNNQQTFGYTTNAAQTNWINLNGYNGAATQFRSLNIGNGKNDAIVTFDGPTLAADFSGAVSVAGDVYTTDWTDWSGSANPSGWDTPTTQFDYMELGDRVYCRINITGTSNATSASVTLPSASVNNGFYPKYSVYVSDAGSDQATPGLLLLQPNSATGTFYKTNAVGSTWTNSGVKTVNIVFWYRK